MVNYFENEHAIPIIIGDCKETISAASIIRKQTDLKVTVLSTRLSPLNKIRFAHRKLTSLNEDIILLTLKDIAERINEYSTPLLIYCTKHNTELISKYISELQQLYVIIPAQEIKVYFQGNG